MLGRKKKIVGQEGILVTKKKYNHKKDIPLYLMLLPGLVYMLINNYLPMFGITIAFKKLDYQKGIFGSDWCGLENFEFLFKTKDAFIMIRNTLLYNLVFISLGLVIALAIAVMMTEIGNRKIAKAIQPIICFPSMVSIVIVAYLVYGFLGSEGFINNTILGGNGISWYQEPQYWPIILTVVHFWMVAGNSSIVYIASMSGIDKELYESARIDGAKKMKQIFYITLPIIKPMIILMLITSIGGMFRSDFGLFLQVPMNSGMLYSTTQTIDTYSYRALMQLSDVGMSSAASVFQAVLGFILILISNGIARKVSKESALF